MATFFMPKLCMSKLCMPKLFMSGFFMPRSFLPGFFLTVLLALGVFPWVPAFAACEDLPPSPSCGEAPTALFATDGTLWTAFVDAGHVWLTQSTDHGSTFVAARQVNAQAEKIYSDAENRPQLGFGNNGEIFVAWTRDTEAAWSGDIRFARSLDGGQSFDPVRTINDDGLLTSHRFVALHSNPQGQLYLAWLDKRDQVAALASGRDYVGAALYYTVSEDGGHSFAANRKVADNSCECCRIALASTADDAAVQALWRHTFVDGTVRDHATVQLGTEYAAVPLRATWDDWRIEGCPHHGPALAAADAGFHMAWFSNGTRHRGVLYGHFDVESGTTSRVQVLEERPLGGHPAVLAQGPQLWLAWNSFDGENMTLKLSQSSDGGQHWSIPQVMLSTAGAADHPQLLLNAQQPWLAWHSQEEGFRLVPLHAEPCTEIRHAPTSRRACQQE